MVTHKKTKVLAQIKRWSLRDQLAFFGMLLAYLKAAGIVKARTRLPTSTRLATHSRGKKGRPKKGVVPPQLRPYLFKKGHRKVRKKRKSKRRKK